MTQQTRPGLVSATWLKDQVATGTVKVFDASLDATLIMPGAAPTGHKEYLATHIPGAHYFDIEELSDPNSALPHTLPSPDYFSEKMQALGLNSTDHVIVYDNSPLKSACRAWWMLRVMGHTQVAVLDGGLHAWKAAGYTLTADAPAPPPAGNFQARFDARLFRRTQEVIAGLHDPSVQIIDPRAAARFEGTAPEPRPGLKAGHIPGARNIPFGLLFNTDGTLKSEANLREIFKNKAIDLNAPVTASCGSGVTASILAFALYTLGKPDVAVYDGSWSEWGSLETTPIETGPARLGAS